MNHINFLSTDKVGLEPCNVALPIEKPSLANEREFSLSDRFCRARLHSRFSRMPKGRIVFHQAEGSSEPRDASGAVIPSDLPFANIYIHDPSFYRRVLAGGTIASAESFVDGAWSTDDLVQLIRVLIQNMGEINGLEKTWSRARRAGHFLWHKLRPNTKNGSRKNIHDHYDLGNDFYSLFLDPTMNYSSGIFRQADDSMHVASLNKMHWICEKLQLKAGERVIEIGTGWGGLAEFMAREYGVHVTTTTISKEQHAYATERIARAGLQDQVEVLFKDYRDLEGTYDKLVSIEMIEAVGHQFMDQYFEKCNTLLGPEGLMLVQAITIGEQHYENHIRTIDFIRRYIFPGGCLPSVASMNQSVGRKTDLRMVHMEDMTWHYERTLQHWRSRFHAELDAVSSQGFDDKFIRLWHFYLCYCEAAFAERRVNVVQAVWGKSKSTLDPSVDFRNTKPVRTMIEKVRLNRKSLMPGTTRRPVQA